MRNKLRELAEWLNISDNAKNWIGICQILSAASATFYIIVPRYETFFAIVFILSFVPVFFSSILTMIFVKRYGLNVLVYHRATGILRDKKTGFLNVALRRKTLFQILAGVVDIIPSDRRKHLYSIGEDIGKNFAKEYRSCKIHKSNAGNDGPVGKKHLIEILQYDSSSGMGRFTLTRFDEAPKHKIHIDALNSLTFETDECKYCEFLAGYFCGLCSYLTGQPSKGKEISCGIHSDNGCICRFEIEEI